MNCPLCGGDSKEFSKDNKRPYFQCIECSLVFVPEEYHLDSTLEKAEYDLHDNDPFDSGYRKFLSRLFLPLKDRIEVGAIGLDFGCGPGPALQEMFQEEGFEVSVYDKFYAKDENVWEKQYDFITATEVFEHLRNPGAVIVKLLSALKAGGVLGIMTKLVIDKERFQNWHYKNDPTHIIFFSKGTFDWIGRNYGMNVEFVGDDVIILGHKKTDS